MSVRNFKADIEKLAKKLDISVGVATTKISLDALEKLVEKTPFKTGRAKSSWAIKEGTASDYVPQEGISSPATACI